MDSLGGLREFGKNICFPPQFPISFFWCLSFLLICIYSFQDEQQNGTFDTLNTWKRSVLITFSVKLHKGKQFLWKGFKRVKIFHSSPKSLLKTLEKISGPEGLWVISFNLKRVTQSAIRHYSISYLIPLTYGHIWCCVLKSIQGQIHMISIYTFSLIHWLISRDFKSQFVLIKLFVPM